jgi:hypothetical protein
MGAVGPKLRNSAHSPNAATRPKTHSASLEAPTGGPHWLAARSRDGHTADSTFTDGLGPPISHRARIAS